LGINAELKFRIVKIDRVRRPRSRVANTAAARRLFLSGQGKVPAFFAVDVDAEKARHGAALKPA
jgi:hypothetical protein